MDNLKISNQRILSALKNKRFLFIHMLTSILFFMNLYWALMLAMVHKRLIWIAVFSFLSYAIAYIEENMAMKNTEKEHLPWSLWIYYSNLFIGFFVLATCFIDPNIAFPFFAYENLSYGLSLFNLFLLCIGIRHIHRIQNKKDRGYDQILEFQRKTNRNGG